MTAAFIDPRPPASEAILAAHRPRVCQRILASGRPAIAGARAACYNPAVAEKTPRIRNKKARHNFAILETIEAGLVLEGSEVKALREGKANIDDAFARLRGAEVWLYNMHIGPYSQAGQFGHDTRRARKLLLRRREINRFLARAVEKGHTLVPLAVYFKRGWAKVELGVARGKREFDKREDLKRRQAQRDIDRELARRRRGG
ncbi:MAG: SsrA-binding protein SmpB [Planctomycetes bacterium]|nr:SsrA-binding protein SmpB [Planctomycetota bacterium]